jgi:hypothetical protein
MEGNGGGFRNQHPFQKSNDGYVLFARESNHDIDLYPVVSNEEQYREIFCDYFDCHVDEIEYTPKNIEKLINVYISAMWLDAWYDERADSFTPHTEFYSLDNDINHYFDGPKFARLNSVSAKIPNQKPVFSLNDAKNILLNNQRCMNVIANANRYNLSVQIAIRDYVNLSNGVEYRSFIYDNKLTAICSNDDKLPNLNSKKLIKRVQILLGRVIKAMERLPFPNVIMDVWICDNNVQNDIVVEFNSFGVWANGAAGLFNWFEDEVILHDSSSVTVKYFK